MKPTMGILACSVTVLFVACDAGTMAPELESGTDLSLLASHKAGHDRPFKGKGEGSAELQNPPGFPGDPDNCAPNTGGGKVCEFDVEGTHRSTHMGRGTYAGDLTLDWSQYGEPGVGNCAIATGQVTFVAANGDELAFDVEDTSRVCETVPASTTHTTSLDLTVDGASSTGRFAGATGDVSSTGTTEATGAGQVDAFTMDGRIAY